MRYPPLIKAYALVSAFTALMFFPLSSLASLAPLTSSESLLWESPSNFEKTVDKGLTLIRKKYNNPTFYEVDVSLKSPAADKSAVDIQKLSMVFGLANGDSVILNDTPPNFEAPVIVHSPFLGDYALQWPLSMTLDQAIDTKNKAGFTQPFSHVTVRTPLSYPSSFHPDYIFQTQPHQFIFVDSVNQAVYAVNNVDTEVQ